VVIVQFRLFRVPGKPERGLKAEGLDLSPGKSRYADAGMEGWGRGVKKYKSVVRGKGNEVWFFA
jgi:hypothetical protein